MSHFNSNQMRSPLTKILIASIVSVSFAISSASAQVSILNDQQYVHDETIHIVGEIENNTLVPLNRIVVTAIFYDTNDEILDTKKTDSILKTIMPGKKGPFDVSFNDKILSQIYRYSLEIEYKPATPKTESLEILSSVSKRDMLDNFIISGTITNHDQKTANSIVIIATLYDKDGRVIATGKSFTKPDYLKEGEIRPFFISVQDKFQSRNITDYSLIAESEEYTIIPEFPLGSGVILLFSVLSYLILTKKPKDLQKSIFV